MNGRTFSEELEAALASVDGVLSASRAGALNVEGAREAADAVAAVVERAEAIKELRRSQGRSLSEPTRSGLERILAASQLLRARCVEEVAVIDATDHRAAAVAELARLNRHTRKG